MANSSKDQIALNLQLIEELAIAKKELLFESKEKAKRVAELVIANEEKAKRAAELDTFVHDIAEGKKTEKGLASQNTNLKALLETASDGVHVLDTSGKLIQYSDSFAMMLGYTDDEIKGLNVRDWDAGISSDRISEMVLELIKTGKIFESQHRRKDGSIIDVEINAKGVFIDGKNYLYASSRDITKRNKLAQELSYERNTLNNLVDTITDLVWLKDLDGIYLRCNAEFEKFFGAKEIEIIGKTDYDFVPKELADSFRENDQEALISNNPLSNEETVTYRSDGHTALLETVKTPMRDEHGKVIGVLGVARNITARKHLEEQVSHMAYYDMLTELPNRRLLMDRLNQLLVGKKRSGLYGALLYIDLDNFKPLNDLHGHEAGDLLLIEVGKRIKQCVREMDTVARIGGDEFVALIGQLKGDETKSLAQAQMIAEKVRIALAKPYEITIEHGKNTESTIEHCCTACIGVVVFSGKATDPDVILSMADVAMYEAKEAGRNRVRLNPSVI